MKWRILAGLTLLVFGGALAGLFLLRSDWFAEQLQQRIVQELSQATGAKVEIGKVQADWRKFKFRAAPVVLRGTESTEAEPLLQAKSLEIGLSLRSFLDRRVDIASLALEEPKVNVMIAADGTTNIPGGRKSGNPAEALVDLAVEQLEVSAGVAKIDDREIPLNGRLDGVHALLLFDLPSRSYRGNIEIREIASGSVHAGFESAFTFGTARVDIQRVRIATPKSSIEGTGFFANWKEPEGELKLNVRADLPELAPWFRVTEVRAGEVTGNITGALKPAQAWQWDGRLNGKGITVVAANQTFTGIQGSTDISAKGEAVALREINLNLLGGAFRGNAELVQRRFRVDGELRNVQIPAEVSATASGPIHLNGVAEKLSAFQGKLALTPTPGKIPLGGNVDVKYDGASSQLSFGDSTIQLGDSRVELSGSLQNGLNLDVRTRDLNELLPAMRLAASQIPDQVPISLDGGLATLQGVVRGSMENPAISGTVTAEKIKFDKEAAQNVSASFNASSSSLELTKVSLGRGNLAVAGSMRAGLDQWRLVDASSLAGNADFRNASIQELLKQAKVEAPVSGLAAGHIAVSGTFGNPQIAGTTRITNAKVAEESLDSINAQFTANKAHVNVVSAEIARGSNKLQGSADWKPGEVAFEAKTDRWDITRLTPLKPETLASGSLRGRLRETNNKWSLAALDGTVNAVAKEAGESTIIASTAGNNLKLQARAKVQNAELAADSTWKLEGQMPGSGTAQLSQLTPQVIQTLLTANGGKTALPFDGLIEGTASFSGNLLDLDQMTGRTVFPTARFYPKKEAVSEGLTVEDLSVRNDGDVVFVAGPRGIVVERARFIAKDTQVEGTGNLSFRRANVWNLLLRGQVNMAVISTFNPDLVASGVSTLNARIRGTFDNPEVEGRVQFENASFNLKDVPNGLDKVNGSILFDRTRANIERLTAESGGGNVGLSGYIGFETELNYQLAAQLNQVRVRYPEGVSTQANAQLAFAGSSRRSLMSGTVTILRSSLTPQTDASAVLARSARPLTSGVSANEFLKGVQFDVRVDTAQSAEFTTQLTKNMQADAELRLRGTPARPVLLGRISITQGEVQFFGTDYKITRGEVNFVNPVTIEPRVDLDLETRVRGIVVSINFTGPLNKLNMSYRSDPPLQSSEILALLAVGRTPTTATTLGVGTLNAQGLLGTSGGNAILSSALSTPSNSGLQRFFGVTRLKIDPQLIGLDNTPQSRVSLEQPISRDVTVTYVQTLARAQGQLVRVQWDLSKEWSALATRDENGVLSIDFIFKRGFK